jgi:hypothetical protein
VLEGAGRSHQQDVSEPAGGHVGGEYPGQLGECNYIELKHRPAAIRIRLDEFSKQGVSRVVDQDVDGEALRPKLVEQFPGGVGLAQVHRNRVCLDPVALEYFYLQRLQPFRPPRDEDHPATHRRQLAREIRAQAARGAGDECGFSAKHVLYQCDLF